MNEIEQKLIALKFVIDNKLEEENKSKFELADEIYNWLTPEKKEEEPKVDIKEEIIEEKNIPQGFKESQVPDQLSAIFNKDYRPRLKALGIKEEKSSLFNESKQRVESFRQMCDEHQTDIAKCLNETIPYTYQETYYGDNLIIGDEGEVELLMQELEISWNEDGKKMGTFKATPKQYEQMKERQEKNCLGNKLEV